MKLLAKKNTSKNENPEAVDTVEVATNQTAFGANEPIFEDATLPPSPEELVAAALKKPKKWWQQNTTWGLIGVGVFFLFLIGLAFLPAQQRQQLLHTAQPTPTPSAQTPEMQARLDEINQDLQNADPVKVDLPYPPITQNISLDK